MGMNDKRHYIPEKEVEKYWNNEIDYETLFKECLKNNKIALKTPLLQRDIKNIFKID